MVSINRSYTVIPSETTPTSTLSLSLCDQIKLPNHGSQLYLYTSNNNTTRNPSIHILITSLSKTLTHYYPLAGRLAFTQGGHLKLLCNSKGALLLEATSILAFENTPQQNLVPTIDYDVPIEDIPLLIAQFTKFPCGSITLGVLLCRALLDGSSAANFMNSWAKLARGEKLDSSLIPFHDRTVLDSRRNFHIPSRFQHLEFFPPPLWEGNFAKVTTKPLYTTAIFKLTKIQVEKLKNKANNNNNKVRRSFTSFEVISGHIWRCVCKVRYVKGNGDQPTRLTTLVNCRNRLNPPLPRTYFGNATFPTVTQTCSFDDVMNNPTTRYAVGKVREAIERVNDEYVRSALDYVANQKDLNLLRDTFYNFGKRNGQLGGNPNLYVVGWTNFPFYETDFGWGKPDCMVPGNINSDGKAFLIDAANGDGFIVAICLQDSHLDALKKLFYEDIEETTSKL